MINSAALGRQTSRMAAIAGCVALVAFAAQSQTETPTAPRLHIEAEEALLHFDAPAPPNGEIFPEPAALPARRGNHFLARALINLVFDLERGGERTGLPKWPQPIAVTLDSHLAPSYQGFLGHYLSEIRRRSRVDISDAADGAQSRISIRIAPTFAMMRRLGSSFCIATPGDLDWDGFERRLDGFEIDPPRWSVLLRPIAATIFVPDRARPHQIRACIMEELLQSLGPAGDFFALTDSIFNDDGARSTPGAFDFLMLRVLYDPTLSPGMSRESAFQAALRVLDRLRPNGSNVEASEARRDDPDWLYRIRLARAQRHPLFAERLYDKAVELARGFPPNDPRLLFSEFERARNRARYEPAQAYEDLTEIEARYGELLGRRSLYVALAKLERAKTALSLGRFALARRLASSVRRALRTHGREDALAEALLVRVSADRGVRRIHTDMPLEGIDALWRDYAFGRARDIVPTVAARDAAPDASPAALSVAIALTLVPVLIFGGLVVTVFRSVRQRD